VTPAKLTAFLWEDVIPHPNKRKAKVLVSTIEEAKTNMDPGVVEMITLLGFNSAPQMDKQAVRGEFVFTP
jgi:hypothetical protein